MDIPKSAGVWPITTVFLDRDGTIIEDRAYLGDPAGVTLLPGAAEGLAKMTAAGLRLFVVTNQSGIGRGYFTLQDYLACRARLNEILSGLGIGITDEAFCPHAPEETCACRKPALGLWRELAERHGLIPGECIIIGDKASDLELGYAAGFALSVLVLTGEGEKTAARLGVDISGLSTGCLETVDKNGRSLLAARDLSAAAQWLLFRLTKPGGAF